MLNDEQIGALVIQTIQNDWHRPFENGKPNQYMIEENITINMYKGLLPPMTQDDVDQVYGLVKDFVEEFRGK